jgi:hypothetical protein
VVAEPEGSTPLIPKSATGHDPEPVLFTSQTQMALQIWTCMGYSSGTGSNPVRFAGFPNSSSSWFLLIFPEKYLEIANDHFVLDPYLLLTDDHFPISFGAV